jgi:hypothetical protein
MLTIKRPPKWQGRRIIPDYTGSFEPQNSGYKNSEDFRTSKSLKGSPIVLVDPARVLTCFIMTLSVGFIPRLAGLLLGRPSGAPAYSVSTAAPRFPVS